MSSRRYTVYRSKDGAIVGTESQISTLGPRDVLIRITHSGVCNADALYAKMGAPMALGHEGIGVVEAVGSGVTQLKLGDRAGGGFHRDSCGHCHYCHSGQDIYCPSRVIYGGGDADNGTFARYYIGKETYVHKIPDSLASADAAPLQCAGAAVYTALKSTVTPAKRVGVVGIGGLGHLAIQFATKFGAEVVALSHTPEKEKEARALGAAEFGVLGQWECKKLLDVVIITSSTYPDFDSLINPKVLANRGIVVPMSIPTGPLSLPAGPILTQGYQIYSSIVASRADHDEMLEFAARQNIKPMIQVFKMAGPKTIQKVFEDLLANKIRYRAVLEF